MASYADLDDDLEMLDSRLTAASNPSSFGGGGGGGGEDYPQARTMRGRAAPAPAPAQAPPPPAASELPRGLIPDLRSWSSRWRFTPELEYIKITRTHPAIYKGMNATGWLCDAYVPIDEEYLSSVWGGGMYVIAVYQNSGGGAREAARGYVQINGNPKAFRGQDGQPVPFPADMNEGKYNGLPGVAAPQSAVQAQAAQQQQHSPYALPGAPLPFPGHYQPPPQQQASNSPQPTIDLISLAEKFSGTRQDSKSLEVLRDAQNANAEFYKSALDKSADEQRQMREQLMSLQQGQTAPLQTALETYRTQMESRERAHNDNMKRMVDEHTAQLNALRAQQEKTLEMMRLQHEKAMEEQRRASDASLLRLTDDVRNREQTVRDSWRVETENLRREIDRIRDESRRELTESREASRREVDLLRESAKIELQNTRDTAKAELQNARDNAQREIQSLRETSQRDLQYVRENATREVDHLKAEADRRENNARESARGMFEGQIRMLETQLAAVKEQLEQRVSDVKSMHQQQTDSVQNNYTLQLQQRDAEINRYRDELQAARNEITQLRTDVQEKSNPMKALSEVAALTQTFQEITGTGGSRDPMPIPEAPKEEEPKTLLAQLAKYAPVIGEHLVKPTLKPISEAVQTVREREAREEQLRQDILLRRQAMQQQQAQLSAQSAQQQQAMQQQAMQQQAMQQQAMQQQVMQQQAMQQRAVQVHQQRQAEARARVRKPAAPPRGPLKLGDNQPAAPFEYAGEPAMPEMDSPAMDQPVAPAPILAEDVGIPIGKDLLDYLAAAMAEGTSPQALSGNLSMGVTFGVVPSETYDKLKTLPTPAVVNAIAAAAENEGVSVLASPRGMDYLESVHKAILAG